ncbi:MULTISPECIES: DUF1349 domain-containing protein [unclassified Bradyrhizobium]|uniref:DUF1349 domain-containing protein n=1 Tax=unclassified Bradyrhizobium TaxID=2631580 RepID=UPI0028EB0F1C|nr:MULTISPECIES: DUF1349 domain-containing protein [unclassified Bradyrhizobium]
MFGKSDGNWFNEPENWSERENLLELATDRATDFWRETHYGFIRDSGHFLAFQAGDAFTAELRVRANFKALYDQAGLMVRVDERCWLKAGIEFSDGRAMLSSVLTAGQSDWATATYVHDASDFRLRVTVAHGVVRLQASNDGKIWPLMRLAPFPRNSSYLVGPMACTPERFGLEVAFSDFRLTPPLGKELHDLG